MISKEMYNNLYSKYENYHEYAVEHMKAYMQPDYDPREEDLEVSKLPKEEKFKEIYQYLDYDALQGNTQPGLIRLLGMGIAYMALKDPETNLYAVWLKRDFYVFDKNQMDMFMDLIHGINSFCKKHKREG